MDFSGVVLSLREDRQVRVLALFRPPIDRACHWVVEYRPRGIWDPLRETGGDTLTWNIRRHPGTGETTRTDVVINFVPPAGVAIAVTERGGRGSVSDAVDVTGASYAVWRCPGARPADRFVLDLHVGAGRG